MTFDRGLARLLGSVGRLGCCTGLRDRGKLSPRKANGILRPAGILSMAEILRRKVLTSKMPVNHCIKAARAMEVRNAEEELTRLSVNGSSWSSWQSPMSRVTLIDRHANTRRILMQVALLPITSIPILILALLAPFDYVAHLRKLARRRARLMDEIRRLRTSPLPLDEPSVRTLRDLWFHCGIKTARVSELDLLCHWVDILYGSGRSAELTIRERVDEMYRQQGEANRAYFDGVEDIHFHFVPPVEFLIRELSEELPPFRARES